jgi:hypothetical protein
MRPRPLLPVPFQLTIRLSSIYSRRDSSVATATGYGQDARQPHVQRVPGLNFFRGWSCRRVRLTIHFHRIKNTWIYTSTSPYAFMTLCLIKNKYDFSELRSK